MKECKKLYRDKYSDLTIALVQDCVKELLELSEKHGIRQLELKEHEIEIPNATFNNDDDEIVWSPVERIAFQNDTIVLFSKEHSAYLDTHYGDYFDVAESLPKIYAAVIDCIEDGLIEEEMKGTTLNTYMTSERNVIPTKVNCRMTTGLGINIEGLENKDVKETLLRTATALQANGYGLPGKKISITVNPTAKKGFNTEMLDMAIALAMIAESKQEATDLKRCAIIGNTDLNGNATGSADIEKTIRYHTLFSEDVIYVPDCDKYDTKKSVIPYKSISDLVNKLKK